MPRAARLRQDTAIDGPLRLRGGVMQGFYYSTEETKGATGPPHCAWTANSDYERRKKPDGTLKSDHELRIEDHPAGFHPWYGDIEQEPDPIGKRRGFCSTDLHLLEALYGRAWLDSDYYHDGVWTGCKSGPVQWSENPPPSDVHLLDDHYDNGVRDEAEHEALCYRKSARVGQWLDMDGSVQLDYDGSLTNINGGTVSDDVRCCTSKNMILDPTSTISALDGTDIPLGLSLNAVARELNEDDYTLAVRAMTGAEPDLMLCHREEEVLELRLQAACEGLVEDRDGIFLWDSPATIDKKVHFLIQAGADMNWADDWGWTPLHCAVSNGNVAAIEALFKYLPELDLEIASEPHGWTVLFRAAYRGHKKIVEMLLGAGANPWHVDSENMTALEVAARYNSTACIAVLCNYMGPEADAIELDDLTQAEEMPDLLRAAKGPGVPQQLAEAWPLNKGDFSIHNRRVRNVSQFVSWTKEDEQMQAFIHRKCLEHRNQTGVGFYPDPDDNPLGLRFTH